VPTTGSPSPSFNSTAQNDAGGSSGSSALLIYAVAVIGALLIVLVCITLNLRRWRARARADAAAMTIAPNFFVPARENTSANEPPSAYDVHTPYQKPGTYGEPVPLQRHTRLDQDNYVATGGTADTTPSQEPGTYEEPASLELRVRLDQDNYVE
jgi:hypothetical protein